MSSAGRSSSSLRLMACAAPLSFPPNRRASETLWPIQSGNWLTLGNIHAAGGWRGLTGRVHPSSAGRGLCMRAALLDEGDEAFEQHGRRGRAAADDEVDRDHRGD